MNNIVYFSAISLLLMGSFTSANACSCMSTSPEVIFCLSDSVALVKIKKIWETREKSNLGDPIEILAANYELIDAYKGDLATNGELRTAKYSGVCGVPLQEGEIALLKISSDGYTNSCDLNDTNLDIKSSKGISLIKKYNEMEQGYLKNPKRFCAAYAEQIKKYQGGD